MSKIFVLEKPVYIEEDNNDKYIVIDMKYLKKTSDKNTLNQKKLVFKFKDTIFIINDDKFSAETIQTLQDLQSLEIKIFDGDKERKYVANPHKN
jgi:hypothetical protein